MKIRRKREARPEKIQITATDFAIIRCLQEDARGSLVKVADALKIPESTIRHRLNRLVEGGLIEFAVVTNPLRFGYPIWAIFEIQAQPSKIRTVAQQLAATSEVHLVGIMTGNYDVYAGALFRTNEEMVDFITGPLARIPGILRVSTSNMLEVVKRTVTFGIPDGSPEPLKRRRRTV